VARREKIVWTVQIVLAALFLFAGVAKLVMDGETMSEVSAQSGLPAVFLRFIAVCEMLGGLGLILPWALNIRRELTPIAAACLVIIMGGAVVTSWLTVSVVAALFPLTTGVLLATVAYVRWQQVRAEQGSG
jgi:uncharacterized membrane protein YphA (DoxX/SURF4 family)